MVLGKSAYRTWANIDHHDYDVGKVETKWRIGLIIGAMHRISLAFGHRRT